MRRLSLAVLFVLFALLVPTTASAMCTICFLPGGPCFTGLDGNCDGYCGGVTSKCYPQRVMHPSVALYSAPVARIGASPAPDYLLSENGRAWVVFKDGAKAPVASDAFVSFVAKTNSKYATAIKDAQTQKQIDDEYAAFRKGDNGLVSASRLQRLSKDLSLSIRDMRLSALSNPGSEAARVKRYPPHGYPCLGCHPCGDSYCDDANRVVWDSKWSAAQKAEAQAKFDKQSRVNANKQED
jgi:hypothetical protein